MTTDFPSFSCPLCSRTAGDRYSPNLDLPVSNETAGNFLKEVDKDIEQIVKCTATKRENFNERSFSKTRADSKSFRHKDPYYGADWGIGCWTATVIMLIVGIITPVFYLLYYEVLVKVDVSHHSTVDSSHLHSGVTAPSQQREIGNGIIPTKGTNVEQQDDYKLQKSEFSVSFYMA